MRLWWQVIRGACAPPFDLVLSDTNPADGRHRPTHPFMAAVRAMRDGAGEALTPSPGFARFNAQRAAPTMAR
jgi:hypothetical protein